MAMKLGRDTGSLTNHIISRMTKGQPEPEVGMGATLLSWSDRHPATVVAVGKTKSGAWLITVQEDEYKRTDDRGFCENQDYEYSRNLRGAVLNFRYDEGKGWRQVRYNDKRRLVLSGSAQGLRIGEREKYHDFSF